MDLGFKNPIWVCDKIDKEQFYIRFTGRFSELMSKTKVGDEVTVFINSPGGDTHTTLGVFDLLRGCRRETIGVVSGIANSGASLILQACKKRFMTENSSLMLHKSAIRVGGSVENAQEMLNNFRRLDEKFYEVYAERMGENVSEIANIAQRDKHFSAQEAVEAGLADEVI